MAAALSGVELVWWQRDGPECLIAGDRGLQETTYAVYVIRGDAAARERIVPHIVQLSEIATDYILDGEVLGGFALIKTDRESVGRFANQQELKIRRAEGEEYEDCGFRFIILDHPLSINDFLEMLARAGGDDVELGYLMDERDAIPDEGHRAPYLVPEKGGRPITEGRAYDITKIIKELGGERRELVSLERLASTLLGDLAELPESGELSGMNELLRDLERLVRDGVLRKVKKTRGKPMVCYQMRTCL